jgi:hypothetical protein
MGGRVRSAAWERASDEAFQEATEEILPYLYSVPTASPGSAGKTAGIVKRACANSVPRFRCGNG